MSRFRIFALASALVMGALVPVAAQQVRNVKMPAPTRVDARLDARGLEENKTRYRTRLQRMSTHHLRVPLRPSSEPFTTRITIVAAAVATRRPGQAELTPGLKIERADVTGSSGMRGSITGAVSEPTVAIRGEEIFVTGNTYAGLSLDGGKSFTYVDPGGMFGETPGDRFCCDQVAAYDAATDTTYWLMQGFRNQEGNSYRLLFAKGRDGLEKPDWYALSIPSVEMLGRKGYWFDFPDVAFSDRHVYVTANVYDMSENPKFSGAVVMRFNKGALGARESHQANILEDDVGCLRLAQGASAVMYWSGHFSPSEVKVAGWKDADSKPGESVMVDVETWVPPTPVNTADVLTANKRPWLRRLDERVTTSWIAEGMVGIAWAAAKDNRFPLPHIRIARIKIDDILNASGGSTRVKAHAQPHIWSKTAAFGYPSAATNDKGEVGIALAYGTGKTYPGFAVGILAAKDTDPPLLAGALTGRNSPPCPKPDPDEVCGAWGDYFTVRRDPKAPSAWVVVGYTLQHRDPQPIDAEAQLVRFSRAH